MWADLVHTMTHYMYCTCRKVHFDIIAGPPSHDIQYKEEVLQKLVFKDSALNSNIYRTTNFCDDKSYPVNFRMKTGSFNQVVQSCKWMLATDMPNNSWCSMPSNTGCCTVQLPKGTVWYGSTNPSFTVPGKLPATCQGTCTAQPLKLAFAQI